MRPPLEGSVVDLREAAARFARVRSEVATIWRDTTFRAIDRRSLVRLDSEARQALASISSANAELAQALRLLED